jgi:hypothetical protein
MQASEELAKLLQGTQKAQGETEYSNGLHADSSGSGQIHPDACERMRGHANACECMRMHANACECIRVHPYAWQTRAITFLRARAATPHS